MVSLGGVVFGTVGYGSGVNSPVWWVVVRFGTVRHSAAGLGMARHGLKSRCGKSRSGVAVFGRVWSGKHGFGLVWHGSKDRCGRALQGAARCGWVGHGEERDAQASGMVRSVTVLCGVVRRGVQRRALD